MKNTTLITLGVGLLLLIAVVSYMAYGAGDTKQTAQTAYSAAALVALQNEYDFGTINMKDGTVSRVFEVKNTGAESVAITNVYTSCMCTTAFVSDSSGKKNGPFGMSGHTSTRANITIGAGESVSVEAVFDPAAHGPSGVGLAERSIYLETNSEEKPRVELKFKAMVTR